MLFLSCVLLDFVGKIWKWYIGTERRFKCDPVCMGRFCIVLHGCGVCVCLRTLTDTMRNRILCRYDDGSKPQCSTARISHMPHFHYHRCVCPPYIYVAAMELFYEIRLFHYISLPMTWNFFFVLKIQYRSTVMMIFGLFSYVPYLPP